ncbi:hypothetical protein DPMN_137043 [Dreissena polymorpha]|uniref:Uncharacterized protein n=1 Tax=Dreissena polymorpha TaxID=45954 RepID=A0A9D4JD87_DREPO|nr:hypothetical protein DPMN_137043 [Dreissena polymorpha]
MRVYEFHLFLPTSGRSLNFAGALDVTRQLFYKHNCFCLLGQQLERARRDRGESHRRRLLNTSPSDSGTSSGGSANPACSVIAVSQNSKIVVPKAECIFVRRRGLGDCHYNRQEWNGSSGFFYLPA